MRRPLLLALLLAACAGSGVRIGALDQSPAYDPSLVRYVTRLGTMAVEVHGSPFGSSGSDAAPVAAVLSAPGWLGAVRFVPADIHDRGYRLVLVFGAGAGEACSDLPALPQVSAAAGLHVQASFCAGRQVLSSLVADGAAAGAPTDLAFRQMMDQVLVNLLPPVNAERIRESDGSGGM
ncbi:MAG TPA: hypothetical protein VMU42_13080 [Candidatus Sulfotelmatobacter sp.]|nr:hypothetical protein [Candidatus Sulfotelmatobacter sp.]